MGRQRGLLPDGASLAVLDEHTFSITTEEVFNPSWFIDNQINKVSVAPSSTPGQISADEAVSDLTAPRALKQFAYPQGEAKTCPPTPRTPGRR